jgi:gliding motility-associated-like protein
LCCDGDIASKDSCLNDSIAFSVLTGSTVTSIKWNFDDPSSIENNSSTVSNPKHLFTKSGQYKISAIVNFSCGIDTLYKSVTIIDCISDTSVCQLFVPNVFTPNNDGINDAFDIDIFGEFEYNLKIFNRWGGKVFEGNKDGKGNDGINWNGKTDNDGSPNPEGVYYYTFKYKFNSTEPERTLHGSITLIRE